MINIYIYIYFEGLMINILNKVIFGQSDLAIVIIYNVFKPGLFIEP